MLPEAVGICLLCTFNSMHHCFPNSVGRTDTIGNSSNGEIRRRSDDFFFSSMRSDTGSINIIRRKFENSPLKMIWDRLWINWWNWVGETGFENCKKRLAADEVMALPTKMSQKAMHHAPKIFPRKQEKIDWANSAEAIHTWFGASFPYRCRFGNHFGWEICNDFLKTTVSEAKTYQSSLWELQLRWEKHFLKFQKPEAGKLRILELQLEGKKRMKIGDFLRG